MSKQVFIKEYSPKCIVIAGDTMPVKDYIMNNGGTYNKGLWIDEKKIPCYIFPKDQQNKVIKLVDEINKKFDEISNIKRVYKNDNQFNEEKKENMYELPKNDFLFTKVKYLSLITRIEKLENDNATLLKLLNNNKQIQKKNIVDIELSSESDSEIENEDIENDIKPKKRLL